MYNCSSFPLAFFSLPLSPFTTFFLSIHANAGFIFVDKKLAENVNENEIETSLPTI
jgi:hypothetical protein